MLIKQDYVETAERIDCPAPLPEDPATAILTQMLVPAPYKVPEKMANKKATGTRKGLRGRATPDASSEDAKAHSSNEDEEEEEEISPPTKGRRKGRPPHLGRLKGPRRERPSLRTTPQQSPTATRSGCPGTSP